MRWVDWYGDGSLYVLDVGLACCTLEFDAAAPIAAGPLPRLDERAQVAVVISGTVTDRLAPAVAAIIDGCEQQAGRRPAVVSFGACASSGGPYWDSYAVTKGVDQLVAVDAYVPGCPPPPDQLQAASHRDHPTPQDPGPREALCVAGSARRRSPLAPWLPANPGRYARRALRPCAVAFPETPG